MPETLAIVLIFIASFMVAALLSYMGTSFSLRRRRSAPIPDLGAHITVRWNAEVYVCRFEGERREGWQLSAPRRKGIRVPMHVADPMTLEVGTRHGVARCLSKLLLRDATMDIIVCELPSLIRIDERRNSERKIGPLRCRFNGVASELLDASEGGARVITSADVSVGDHVRLEIDNSTQYGWALEVSPAVNGARAEAEIRMCYCS